MFDFFKRKPKDDLNSVEFLTIVLEKGSKTISIINDVLKMEKETSIKKYQDNINIEELLGAIFGASFGILNGYSKAIPKKRGQKINRYCKSILISSKFESNPKIIKISIIEKYEEVFREAINKNINPFEEISAVLLVRSFKKRIGKICIPGTNNLNPFIHQTIADIIALTVADVMKFWKDK